MANKKKTTSEENSSEENVSFDTLVPSVKQAIRDSILEATGNDENFVARLEQQNYVKGLVYRIGVATLPLTKSFSQEVTVKNSDGSEETKDVVRNFVVIPTDKGTVALARFFSRYTQTSKDFKGELAERLKQSSSPLDFAAILCASAQEASKDIIVTIDDVRKDKTGFKNADGVEQTNTQLVCSYDFAD